MAGFGQSRVAQQVMNAKIQPALPRFAGTVNEDRANPYNRCLKGISVLRGLIRRSNHDNSMRIQQFLIEKLSIVKIPIGRYYTESIRYWPVITGPADLTTSMDLPGIAYNAGLQVGFPRQRHSCTTHTTRAPFIRAV
jgi:hypothetical protein